MPHQATTSTSSQPTSAPSVQRNLQADSAAVIDTIRISELLWNRSDPSQWGQYKSEMANELNMKTLLTLHADAKKMLSGHNPTVSGVIPNSRSRLAFGRRGTIQFQHYSEIGGSAGFAQR